MTFEDIIKDWLKYSQYKDNFEYETQSLGQYCLNKDNQNLINFLESNEPSKFIQMVTLLYAKSLFIDNVKNAYTPRMYNLLTDKAEEFASTQKMFAEFNSDILKSAEQTMLQILDRFKSMVCGAGKVIGKTENAEMISDIMYGVLKDYNKLNLDIYLKDGIMQSINYVHNEILIFNTLGECLLTVEGYDDGLYMVYISQNNSVDGYFSYIIKNNGNLFGLNDRINEAYLGAHANSRNHHYIDDKKWNLFPYSLMKFEKYDYKGYASNSTIDREKTKLSDLNDDDLLPILIVMLLIDSKYKGTTLQGDKTYVTSLFKHNLPKLLESSGKNELIVTDKSAIIKSNDELNITYTSEAILNNKLGEELSYKPTKKDRKYDEIGHFNDVNHELVEIWGKDFEIDNDSILKSTTNLMIETKDTESSPQVEFIGNEKRMQLQSYYEARKQLADYIQKKMDKALDDFGGVNGLRDWYENIVEERKDYVVKYFFENMNFGNISRQRSFCGSYLNEKLDYAFSDYRRGVILNKRIGGSWNGKIVDLLDETRPVDKFIILKFKYWQQVRDCLGLDRVPDCMHGWREHRASDGNSILNATDAVADVRFKYEGRGMMGPDFDFDVCIGFTKRSFNKLCKDYGVDPEVQQKIKNLWNNKED